MSQPTPYYKVDLHEVQQAYEAMSAAFPDGIVYYCVKACGEPRVLRHLAAMGALFEVSSSAELQRVQAAGANSAQTICGLPVMSDSEVSRLWSGGVRQFVFDHVTELARLTASSPDVTALLRLRPESVDPEDPFGMTWEEFASAAASRRVTCHNTQGVTIDLRSNRDLEPVRSALRLCRDVIQCLGLSDNPLSPIVNVGGNYRLPGEVGDEFYKGLRAAVRDLWPRQLPRLQMEIGRSIVKFAGHLVTTVILVRQRGTRLDVFVDAGEPAGVSHAPTALLCHRKTEILSKAIPARFWGMTCGRKPLFDTELGFEPAVGDKLILEGMGSYTICKQSDFHAWPRTPVLYTAESDVPPMPRVRSNIGLARQRPT